MKIRPKSLELQQEEAAQLDRKQKADRAALDRLKEGLGESKASKGDQVEVSTLATALNGQLNPASFAEERKAKIEDIKERIKNGTYNPRMEDVARALAEEISSEILSSGGLIEEAKN